MELFNLRTFQLQTFQLLVFPTALSNFTYPDFANPSRSGVVCKLQTVTQLLIRPALIQKPSENSRIQLFKIG